MQILWFFISWSKFHQQFEMVYASLLKYPPKNLQIRLHGLNIRKRFSTGKLVAQRQ